MSSEEDLEADPGVRKTHLLALPNELLLQILSYLSGHELACVSETCTRLSALSSTPFLWISLLSAFHITSPEPYPSFKHLYGHLYPYLWLGARLWFSDRRFTGHVAVSHYWPKTGEIIFHTLLAPLYHGEPSFWSLNPTVSIDSFAPVLKLWTLSPFLTLPPSPRLEIIETTLQRAAPIPTHKQTLSMALWPPLRVPAEERTRNLSQSGFLGAWHNPAPNAAGTSIFRVCKKMRNHSSGESETFAAVEEKRYTPDAKHPWRGVWVGDYSAHGCEVVLFHQPERMEGRVLSGIKLSGDINVPRGECTFHVPDLLDEVRIAHEREWPGARVVRGFGQIADVQHRDPNYIDCEIILINHNEVALHWIIPNDLYPEEPFECISRFRRVDVDRFIFGDGVQDFAKEG